MSKSPKLAFVEKNSGMVIEELLTEGIDPDGAVLSQILELCTHYRRVGVCRWLTRGDANLLFAELTNSAWVFAAWLAKHGDDDKRTSQLDPLINAVVAEATDASKAIIAHARRTWNENVEYEEDFYYARILHHLITDEASQAAALLKRWATLTGGEEPRHQICAALLSHDVKAMTDGMERLLNETSTDIKNNSGRGDPDAAVSTDRLFLEGIALLKIARSLGLMPVINHGLIHAPLLSPPTKPLPGPNDWKIIENHRDLT